MDVRSFKGSDTMQGVQRSIASMEWWSVSVETMACMTGSES